MFQARQSRWKHLDIRLSLTILVAIYGRMVFRHSVFLFSVISSHSEEAKREHTAAYKLCDC